MSRLSAAKILALTMAGAAPEQKPPLLAEKDVAALANELSGPQPAPVWKQSPGS